MKRLRRWLRAKIPGASRRAADREARETAAWIERGRPAPPPHAIKRAALKAYGARFGLRTLVETGTYRGEMLAALQGDFDQLISIELSEALYAAARKRFRGLAHVKLLQGDSGRRLGEVVPRLDRPALFWLDGHWSGGATARGAEDTPVLRELDHILGTGRKGDVILIDDARCFGREPGYPTQAVLEAHIRASAPSAEIEIVDDSVRITPARSSA